MTVCWDAHPQYARQSNTLPDQHYVSVSIPDRTGPLYEDYVRINWPAKTDCAMRIKMSKVKPLQLPEEPKGGNNSIFVLCLYFRRYGLNLNYATILHQPLHFLL